MHLDAHLAWLLERYHDFAYVVLSLIVFLENGVIFTPFLPGDSLIFVCGSFAAAGSLDIRLLLILLIFFSALGSTMNYWIGRWSKTHLKEGRLPFIKPAYIAQTQNYFDRYGALTIGVAKFLPVVRTFAPFMAGLGEMNYFKFMLYNIVGSIAWISFFLFTGYYFGRLPIVANNLMLIIIGILVISILPILIRILFSKKNNQ
jgi:membrane-associated protein